MLQNLIQLLALVRRLVDFTDWIHRRLGLQFALGANNLF